MSTFEDNHKTQRNLAYMTQMRPVFFKKALFSDTTQNYVIPAEPNPYGNVTIRFRTAKNNVDFVYCIINGERIPMSKAFSDDLFDFYECHYTLSDVPIQYYFDVLVGKISCYYDASGPVKSEPTALFKVIPGFHTPKWAKGAVMYQIYVERFNNADPTNDVCDREYYYIGGYVNHVDDWNKIPNVDGTKEFYGGDLQGVIDKLDYLKDLGVDCIYFNPLFVSPSNHKYDSQDYEHIDPHFGVIVKDGGECLQEGDCDNRHATKYQTRVCSQENLKASDELFERLVNMAHSKGIRVILDGVFNHCGSFNKWMDRECIYEGKEGFKEGAYVSETSPYHSFFDFRENSSWPYNREYDGWWGHDTLPKLNYESSPKLYDKIMEIGEKWVRTPFHADGWRLDVAADLGHSPEFNHEFFKRFRRVVKDANPEALILAEHYGDPESWLNGKEWDSVMNYDGFMEPVTWFLTGMQKHSDDFRQDMLGNSDAFWSAMSYATNRFAYPSLEVAMNQLSNHDHSRFLTRTNGRVGRTNTLGAQAADEGVNMAVMRQAVAIQMTWCGAPTIYYGDEAGVTGFTDPDNRRTFPWGHEDLDLTLFHKEMIRIHKENTELINGSLKKIISEPYLIGYARFTRQEATYVIIWRGEEERQVDIPVWEAISVSSDTEFEQIMLSTREGFDATVKKMKGDGSHLKTMLPALSAVVIRSARKKKEY